MYFQNNKRYDILTVLSNRYPATGGGEHMEIVISFLPTGIIAYADQEINMQVILKQIKKSKPSPWFMPYFSKMAQLIGLLSVVGVHPWLLLVLQ